MSWIVDLTSDSSKNKAEQFDFKGTFSANKIIGITGPSGSGKSTLVRLLCGLNRSAQGNLHFHSTNGFKKNPQAFQTKNRFMLPRQRNLGCVFQHDNLFPHKSVRLNIRFAQAIARRRGRRHADSTEFATEIFETLGVTPWFKKQPQQLSGGQKQLVALARSIVSEPQALILDEPFTALDTQSKQLAFRVIRQYQARRQGSILFVSHHLNELGELADEVVNINHGRIESHGSTDEFFSQLHSHPQFKTQKSSCVVAAVQELDTEYHLWAVTVDGQTVWVPHDNSSKALHDEIRLVIEASDISVSKNNIEQSSILNNLQVTVSSFEAHQRNQVLLYLKLNSQVITAIITQKSFAALKIKQNDKLWAHIKSVSLASNYCWNTMQSSLEL